MADEDKTVYIGIELDRQSQSAFNFSLDKMRAGLVSAFDKAQQSIRNDTSAVDDLRKSLNEAADEAENLQKASSGSGGFGVEGLRRTGGALSQLGLSDVGGGISRVGDIGQVGKEVGMLGEGITALGLAAGPVALIVAGVAVGIKVISDRFAEGKTEADKAIVALDAYYGAIVDGTTKTIQSQIQELQIKKLAADAELKDAQSQLAASQAKAQISDPNSPLAIFNPVTKAIDSAGGATKEWADKVDTLTKNSQDLQGKIDGLTQAMGSDAVAANDAKAAQEALTQQILKEADATKQKFLSDAADSQLSADAAQKKKKQSELMIQADIAEIQKLQQSGDQSEATQKKISDLMQDISNLQDEIGKLAVTTIPAAMATEAHTKALADMTKAAHEASKQQADMATAVAKADDDVTKIKEQSLQKQIDIEKKYQDTLVQAAQRAAQQAEDDLRKLHDQQSQLTTNFNHGELDAQQKAQYEDLTVQIKGQEEQAKSYREHLDRLKDIQRTAQEQDALDALNRNFAGIFERKLTTRSAMEGENTSFGRSERERTIAQQQATVDAQRQRAFDRQQRLEAYQQANADARRQYEIQLRDNQIAEQRTIAQARQAKTTELNDLSRATSQALSIRHQGLIAELQLITQGEQQKLQIQAQFYQRAVQLLNNAVNNVGSRIGGSSNAALMHATALQTTQIIGQTFGIRA